MEKKINKKKQRCLFVMEFLVTYTKERAIADLVWEYKESLENYESLQIHKTREKFRSVLGDVEGLRSKLCILTIPWHLQNCRCRIHQSGTGYRCTHSCLFWPWHFKYCGCVPCRCLISKGADTVNLCSHGRPFQIVDSEYNFRMRLRWHLGVLWNHWKLPVKMAASGVIIAIPTTVVVPILLSPIACGWAGFWVGYIVAAVYILPLLGK